MFEFNFPYLYNPALISTKIPNDMLEDLLGFARSEDARANPVEDSPGSYWFPYHERVDGLLNDSYRNWREMFEFEDYQTQFDVRLNYMKTGDHVMTHANNDAFASCILWLNVPKQGEKLTLTYPLLGGQIYHNVIDITPEQYNGTLIMFPGYLNYSVYPKIDQDEERIVLTTNVIRYVRRDSLV